MGNCFCKPCLLDDVTAIDFYEPLQLPKEKFEGCTEFKNNYEKL